MKSTRPDFAEQIKKDMELTSDESAEFLKLEVAWLAASLTHQLIDAPDNDTFENREYIKDYAEQEAEYDALLDKASPRVVEAMKRLFEMNIAYLKSAEK